MGSLGGHVVPGCFFLVFGLAWAVMAFWTGFKLQSRSKKAKKPDGASSYSSYKHDHRLSRKSWIPQPCCQRIPVEPILKILLPLMGVIVEEFFEFQPVPGNTDQIHLVVFVYTPVKNGQFMGEGKLQHIIMYSVFLVSGVIDLLTLCVRLPPRTSQLFLTLAFLAEGLLFYFHVGSEDRGLSTSVHQIITAITFACMFFSALRMLRAANLFVNSGLAFSIILQGSWFIQAGYLLFPPDRNKPWLASEQNADSHTFEHDAVMFVAVCLVSHIICLALFLLALWIAMQCCAVRYGWSSKKGHVLRPLGPSAWADTEERERLIEMEENPTPHGSARDEVEEDGVAVGIAKSAV